MHDANDVARDRSRASPRRTGGRQAPDIAALAALHVDRAAGVMATLRKRLQVDARVRRDAGWVILPALELLADARSAKETIEASLKLDTGQRQQVAEEISASLETEGPALFRLARE